MEDNGAIESGPDRDTTRRQFVAAGLATGIATPRSFGAAPARKPNILLIVADQFRADCVGADGNRAIRTPNLDRLARDGALFEHAYSSTPSCTPARSALLTGWAPWHHGMLGYGAVAEHYQNEMPRMLREAGYQTMGIGKMHWRPQRNLHGFHATALDESGRVEAQGFVSDYRLWFREQAPDLDPDATGIGWNDYASRDYALPERLHPTRWTADKAVEHIEGCAVDRPQFLKVSFARPHSPYDPPKRLRDFYDGDGLPPACVGDWAEVHAHRGEVLRKDTWWGDLGAEQVRRSRQGYYGSITFIDEQIGRIVQALKRRGLYDNTLVVFTADHGDMLGDHHLWRKTFAYEGSARIPFIVRWPRGMALGRRGRRIRCPVELRDVLPTLLDAAGDSKDGDRFDGASVLGPLRSEESPWRPWVDLAHCSCYWRENDWDALTDGHYKYIYWGLTGEQQLFDLDQDPMETHDISDRGAHAATLRLWRSRMVEHLSKRGEPWVSHGDLGVRPTTVLYSPHFPARH